jgi:hypothetical protein
VCRRYIALILEYGIGRYLKKVGPLNKTREIEHDSYLNNHDSSRDAEKYVLLRIKCSIIVR